MTEKSITKFKNKDFVHFHNHSEFSSFDGLSKVDDMVLHARKEGYPALALTDHGNIGGFIKFLQKCSATKDKKGQDIPYPVIKPILGSEFYLCRKKEWKNKDAAEINGGYQTDGRKGNRHLNLFAMNWKGYQNICALSEKSWVDGYYNKDPRIDIDLLAEHSEGLLCGSACLSSVINANLLHNRYDKAKKTATMFKDIFKENLFLEVMYHGISEEAQIIPDILKLSKELNIPALCTNDCLTPGHLILTSRGFIPIEDISVNDKVMTHLSRFKKVLYVNKRIVETNEKVYKVRGYLGGDILEATGNHPVLVGKDKRVGNKRIVADTEWKNVEDLTTNDYLTMPKINREDIFSSNSDEVTFIDVLDYFEDKKSLDKTFIKNEIEYIKSGRSLSDNKNIPRYLPVNKEFLRIIGLFIAEGYARPHTDSQVGFSFHEKENKLIKEVKDYFNSFGFLATECQASKKGRSVRIVSSVFSQLLSKMCGRISSEKRLPVLFNKDSFWRSWTSEQLSIVIQAYIEGDGHEPTGRKPIVFGSTSSQLIREISSVFNAWGILSIPVIRQFSDRKSFIDWRHKNPKADISNWNDLYVLHISGNNKFRLQDILLNKDIKFPKGKQNYCEDEENFYVKISSIEESKYSGYVYNFQVEEDESYVANCISVHNCHYTHKHQAESQEVLMCASTSNCLSNPKHIHFPYKEFYMKSAQEMAVMFKSAPQLLHNTVSMSRRIDTADIEANLFGGMRLPNFELPEGFDDPYVFLVHLAKQGMKRLGWDKSPEHITALKKELKDIQVAKDNNNYDFATYFLIVWDYINFARNQGIITGGGRGSGYASVLLRCLDITYGPDPVKYKLLWERFLGFDEKRFIMEKDFGFTTGFASTAVPQTDALEDDRELEEDLGGVDRY